MSATESSEVTAGNDAQAAEYNALRNDLMLGQLPLDADSDGATITFDLSDADKGNWREVTLGGNRTLALSNVGVGQRFVITLIQDGTGGRTVNWFSTIKWPADVEPTLSTDANKRDTFGFRCISSGNYEGYVIGQNL